MKLKLAAAVAVCLVASGCQTAGGNGEKQWVQIQAGDVFEVADAKCKMMAQTQQTGMYAQGTAGFVIGAQLGNAIGNAIRMDQFYHQCMIISGWKQVPVVKPKPAFKPIPKPVVKAKKTV
jgi:hypothetical protein